MALYMSPSSATDAEVAAAVAAEAVARVAADLLEQDAATAATDVELAGAVTTLTTSLSPLSYGAVGDGTTDDTAALRAWVAAVGSLGVKGLAPKRIYLISNTIDLPANAYVDFGGATLKVAAGTAPVVSGVRVVGGLSGVRICNLLVDGNSGNRTLGSSHPHAADEQGAGNGVAVRATAAGAYASGITIENVHTLNTPGYGISVRGCERVLIRGCSADGWGDDGFDVGGASTPAASYYPARHVSIVNCWSRNSTGVYSANASGFEVDDGSYHVTITGCVSETVGNGYAVHPHAESPNPGYITINGNEARDCTIAGVDVSGVSPAISTTVSIVGNTISGAAPHNIKVGDSTGVSIVGNTCESDIYVYGACNDVTVSGNTARAVKVLAGTADAANITVANNTLGGSGGDGNGVSVIGTDPFYVRGAVIAGNVIDTVSNRGITLQRVGVPSVTGNTITGHAFQGIFVDSFCYQGTVGNNTVNGTATTSANTECILVQAPRTTVTGNRCNGGITGIRMSFGSNNSTVAGNAIDDIGTQGLLLASTGVAITGCTFLGAAGKIGIAGSTSTTGSTIVGCVFTGITGAAPISQTGTANFWLIVGNSYIGMTNSLAGANNVVANNMA